MMLSIVKCDLCGQQLNDKEIKVNNSLIQIGGSKPTARSHIIFIFDGAKKEGSLCFKCGKEIRDLLEEMKGRK